MEVDVHEDPRDWQFREVSLLYICLRSRGAADDAPVCTQDPTAILLMCACLPLWTYRARLYVVERERVDESCPVTAILSLLWPCALGCSSFIKRHPNAPL